MGGVAFAQSSKALNSRFKGYLAAGFRGTAWLEALLALIEAGRQVEARLEAGLTPAVANGLVYAGPEHRRDQYRLYESRSVTSGSGRCRGPTVDRPGDRMQRAGRA